MPEKKTQRKTTKTVKTTASQKLVKKEKPPVRSKRSVQKVEKTEKAPMQTPHEKKSEERKNVRVKRSYIITALVIAIAVLAIFLARKYLIAAMVNGQPISRLSVISELERQGGKQTLDTLITKTLIKQEAKKRNVTISQQEIDNELKRLETSFSKQGQKLDQVLEMNGMTKQQLVEQIELQKMIEKMVGDKKVTDKDIDDYIARNKESLPQDQDEKTLRNNARSLLEDQKLKQKAQTFLEDLRKNAKIERYVSY